MGVGGDVGEGGQRGECGVAGMGGGVGSFEELVDHLGAAALLLALGVLLIIAHRDHQIQRKAEEQHASALIEDVEAVRREHMLQQRRQSALEQVEAGGSHQEPYEEEQGLPIAGVEAEGSGRYADYGDPIYPDEGIEEIEDEPLEKHGIPLGIVGMAEPDDAALLVGIDHLLAEGDESEDHHHHASDAGHPHIVHHSTHIYAGQHGGHQQHDGHIAEADSDGERIGLAEAIMYAGLQHGEETWTKAEEQREADA